MLCNIILYKLLYARKLLPLYLSRDSGVITTNLLDQINLYMPKYSQKLHVCNFFDRALPLIIKQHFIPSVSFVYTWKYLSLKTITTLQV